MKTSRKSDLPIGGEAIDLRVVEHVHLQEATQKKIELSTFSLTDLVNSVLRDLPQPLLHLHLSDNTLVVAKSDQRLIKMAIRHVFKQLLQASAVSNLRLNLTHRTGVSHIELICGGLNLSADYFSGNNSADNDETHFGFYLARQALKRVKGKLDILSLRDGGCQIIIEVPNVRGQAS